MGVIHNPALCIAQGIAGFETMRARPAARTCHNRALDPDGREVHPAGRGGREP